MSDDPTRRARVRPAQKLIQKPKDLIAVVEGKNVAVMALGFAEHTFQDDTEPTPTVTIAVVDVEADPPAPLAALPVSWRRVVGALRMAEPGVWVVGRFVREEEYQAVELLPPTESLDLDQVAARLGELELAATGGVGQLALPIIEGGTAAQKEQEEQKQGVEEVDDIPF